MSVGFHDHLANQVVFSKCGKYLASSSSDYSVRIWKVPSLELISVLNHNDDVEGISFNAGSTKIATASRDCLIRVFSIEGQTLNLFEGHSKDALTVEWIDEKTIISCGDDSTLRYWHTVDNICLKVIDLGGMETDTLCVTSNGLIISGNDDGELTCFDSDANLISSIKAHDFGVKRLLTNNGIIISLSYDRTFRIWSLQNQALVLNTTGVTPNIVWPRSCAFLDENRLAFVTFGDRVAIYNLDNGNWITDDIEETNGINAILVKDNGIYTTGDSGIIHLNNEIINKIPSLCNFIVEFEGEIYCGGQDGTVYNALTADVVYSHHSPLNCADTVSNDSIKSLVVGSYTGDIIQFSIVQGNLMLVKVHNIHNNAIKDISTKGSYIFTVCADHQVKLSEFIGNLVMIEKFSGKHEKIVNGCTTFNNAFASISRDLTLRIWSLDGGSEVIKTPHKNSIKCIASNERDLICTGDYRGILSIYDIKKNIFELKKISISGISSVQYIQLKNEFIASTYDGKLHHIKL